MQRSDENDTRDQQLQLIISSLTQRIARDAFTMASTEAAMQTAILERDQARARADALQEGLDAAHEHIRQLEEVEVAPAG